MEQFPNQQPGPPMGGPPFHGKPPGEGTATAALVVGIIALVIYFVNVFIPFLEVIVGVVGIILATKAKNEGYTGGNATGGLVCSIIAVVLGAMYWTVCVLCLAPLCALPFMS